MRKRGEGREGGREREGGIENESSERIVREGEINIFPHPITTQIDARTHMHARTHTLATPE